MNEPENRTPESSEIAELQGRCNTLNRQMGVLLVALFVVSGTLTVFLGVQSRRVGKNLQSIQPQAQMVIAASQKEAPVISSFMAKLVDYGRTHPDFAPIMVKYHLNTNAAASGTNSSSATAAPKK
jgi:hypothetical protein